MNEELSTFLAPISERMNNEFGTAVQSFASGAPTFALHLGVTLIILWLGVSIYGFLTPFNEAKEIKRGNAAAAVALGGIIVSLSIPLAAVMATSINWADIVVWGVATLFVMLFVLRVVDLFLSNVPKRIANGEVASAVLLVSVKLAVAFVLAAAAAGAPLARY